MRSAPTLKIWITPFASVAMLEKLALLKIALWSAPVLSRSSRRRSSVRPGAVAAPLSGTAESRYGVDTVPSLPGAGSKRGLDAGGDGGIARNYRGVPGASPTPPCAEPRRLPALARQHPVTATHPRAVGQLPR